MWADDAAARRCNSRSRAHGYWPEIGAALQSPRWSASERIARPGAVSVNISEGLTHAISHLALVGTCGGVLGVAASACAGLCAAGHTRLAPVRIVEIDTATHSGVSYVVRPARYTTAGTVMVDAPPREYEVTFDGMGFVR